MSTAAAENGKMICSTASQRGASLTTTYTAHFVYQWAALAHCLVVTGPNRPSTSPTLRRFCITASLHHRSFTPPRFTLSTPHTRVRSRQSCPYVVSALPSTAWPLAASALPLSVSDTQQSHLTIAAFADQSLFRLALVSSARLISHVS